MSGRVGVSESRWLWDARPESNEDDNAPRKTARGVAICCGFNSAR